MQGRHSPSDYLCFNFVVWAEGQMEINDQLEAMIQKQIDGTFLCLNCGYSIQKKSNMKKHVETHISTPGYHCNFCPKQFKTKNSLNTHTSNNHREEKKKMSLQINIVSISCQFNGIFDIIKSYFILDGTLDYKIESLITKTSIGELQCMICGKTSTVRQNIRNHIETHVANGGFNCDLCGKLFKTRNSRSVHKSLHHKNVTKEGNLYQM